jgi:arsenate reductase
VLLKSYRKEIFRPECNPSFQSLHCIAHLDEDITDGSVSSYDARSQKAMIAKAEKLKVLFLCTGNSCRSQMAEAWTRVLKGDRVEAYSAGVDPHDVDPRAVQLMAEVGIDISGQTSKDVDTLEPIEFDYVITLCDQAHQGCPFFPAKTRVLHVGFDDPPRLAAGAQTEEEAMAHYRRVRDEIKEFVEKIPEILGE